MARWQDIQTLPELSRFWATTFPGEDVPHAILSNAHARAFLASDGLFLRVAVTEPSAVEDLRLFLLTGGELVVFLRPAPPRGQDFLAVAMSVSRATPDEEALVEMLVGLRRPPDQAAG